MLLLVDTAEFVASRRFVEDIRSERSIQRTKLQVGDQMDVFLRIWNVRNVGANLVFEDKIPAEFKLTSGSNKSTFSKSTRDGMVEMRYRIAARQMGDYELGNLNAFVLDALGLMNSTVTLSNSSQVEVYPRIKMMYPHLVPRSPVRTRSISLGQRSILEVGHGGDFYGVRDYHSGDELKHIVWKAVARKPEHTLMTREHEAEKDRRVVLAFHAKQSMLDGMVGLRKLDSIVEAIVALAYVACNEAVWLSIAFGSNFLPLTIPGRGRDRQLASAVASLYKVKTSDSFDLPRLVRGIMLNARRGSTIILVTDSEYNAAEDLLSLRPLVENNTVVIVAIRTTSLFQQPFDTEAQSCYEIIQERENAKLSQMGMVCSKIGIDLGACDASELLEVLQSVCSFRGV
jgi:uncharacterized protein (DUF58 family)